MGPSRMMDPSCRSSLLACVNLVVLTPAIAVLAYAEEGSERFADARSVIAAKCLDCHNPSDKKGGFDLTTEKSFRAGGDQGPSLDDKGWRGSLIWRRISDGDMPPDEELSAKERSSIERWLAEGAEWSWGKLDPFERTSERRAGYDWWSLQPLEVDKTDFGTMHPVDYFVERELRRKQLASSPLADRRTLLRRLTYDLHGLPPTREQLHAFVSDTSPDTYRRMIDTLLDSPAYGQRWARHWLDVVRFGESQGFERDRLRTNAWRYRDWVVDAFNRDLPYDEFCQLQIAGDVLYPSDPSAAIATGFLVAGPYDEVGQKQQSAAMRAVVRQDELEEMVSLIGQTFLGLTVNCSRCHDHKFDPISQREYYRMAAALAGVRHGEISLSPESVSSEAAPLLARIDARLNQLNDQLQQQERNGDEEPFYEELKFERDQLTEHRQRLLDTKAYAVAPQPPTPTYVLDRGNPGSPIEEVAAGGVAAIRGVEADFVLDREASEAERRVGLARWIANDRNPLFARVIVNRVFHYHFGAGIVETPNDFGFHGGRPTHPELLDWLARDLIEHGWSLKHLHRQLLTSNLYQQSSAYRGEAAAVDGHNRLWWRKSPMRLDAESLRDTLLFLSGKLDLSLGGPGFYEFTTFVHNSQFYEAKDTVGESFARRTLYRTWVRSARNNLLDVFDCPDPSTKTPQRAITTTPLQSLSLLNSSLAMRVAEQWGEQAVQSAGSELNKQIAYLYETAFQRSPSSWEREECESYVARHGLSALCRVLLNCNELLYLD